MATGTQVPWTDPGGEPCCCEEECFVDYANEPQPVYADETFDDITSADYSALYAGGSYAADVQVNIEAARDNTNLVNVFTATETHVISATGVSLDETEADAEAAPCYVKVQSDPLTVNVTNVNRSGTTTSSYTAPIQIARSLGSKNGSTQLSLASVNRPEASPSLFNILYLDGNQESTFSQGIGIYSGNVINTLLYSSTCIGARPSGSSIYNQTLPEATASISLSVNDNIYSAVNPVLFACFLSAAHYDQVINGEILVSFGFPLEAHITGSVSIAVTFTPSAP